MRHFFNSNKQLILATFSITILAGIFLFAGKFLPHLTLDRTNQLAQIIAVETELLRQWQQSKGLKNTLAYNSSGSDVSLLQKMLSQDQNIYPEKNITGYYGNLTKDAVQRFQVEYNLPRTGVVDVATKNKLNEIFLQFLCPEQTTIYPNLFNRKIQKQQKLPSDYVPSSLVNITNQIKTSGITCVGQEVVEPLMQMFRDAEQDEVYLAVTSGYRKPDIQKYLYDFWLRIEGPDALDGIAEPGASEHQLGTTVDLTDASIRYAGVDDRFGNSDGGKWLSQNAHKYGFVMSYPKGKEKTTGYKYEPWHWRFVGKDIATAIYNQNTTFNELSFDVQKKPFPKTNLNTGLDISVNAVFSMFIDPNGTEYVLLEKNKDRRLPIASLTKLMVALVASDTFRHDDVVVVSQSALNNKGVSGYYVAGDTFSFNDALHTLLIGSHNDIAISMAEQMGVNKFVQLMNEKARILGLADTHYVNVTGLDPEVGSEEMNYSTASDVSKLLKYIFENRADLFSILEKSEYTFTEIQSSREISLKTTDELIADQNLALHVLGGETGETPKAKMNLAIVSDAPVSGRIVSVILTSGNSFYDMRALLQYVKNSFVW
mgnify:FL=1